VCALNKTGRTDVHTFKLTTLAFVALAVLPRAADATVYNLHVGGVCSTNFADGKASDNNLTQDGLGYWVNETSVHASVNQTSSMATAAADLKARLDTYCLNGHLCYIYTYSNGAATLSKVLSTYSTAWNIGYAYNAGSNEGGSELSATDWLAEFIAGCSLAGGVTPGVMRVSSWNHNDTNGETIYQVGGDITSSWALWWATSGFLPGEDDGIVALHSAGGATCGGGTSGCSISDMCAAARWSNHSIVGTCYGYNLDHAAMKRKAICNDGGGGTCP
jgi:hypothetical protein